MHATVSPAAKTALMTIEGDARAVLGAERPALNFLGHLSALRPATAALANDRPHQRADLLYAQDHAGCARWRYAVRAAAAQSPLRPRRLDLIKDNHIAVAGGVTPCSSAPRRAPGIGEDRDRGRHAESIARGDGRWRRRRGVLDNMPPAILREAVAIMPDGVLEPRGHHTFNRRWRSRETGVDICRRARSPLVAQSDVALDIEM